MELKVTNVNQALSEALINLALHHEREPSRNGEVLVFPEPVTTIYMEPTQRVLFLPERDANPFFHLMEALWMLAGRNDVEWITAFNSKFAQFSDDGQTFHGAYGYRWRKQFGYDQLPIIAKELRTNPEGRRCVLTMWDAMAASVEIDGYNPRLVGYDDLHYALTTGTKDAPCNTHIYFDARNGAVNMTVCCRSNDLWMGAYGANAVHMSVLQEVMAAWAGFPVGVYRQFSNNLHLYTNYYQKLALANTAAGVKSQLTGLGIDADIHDYYKQGCLTYPLVEVHKKDAVKWWFEDLEQFMRNPMVNGRFKWRSSWFADVAVPVYAAWAIRKLKRGSGFREAAMIKAPDWQRACVAWLTRAEERRAQRPDTAASA